MSHYAQGAAFERKTRKHLEENGYEVIRSAGSKGKVDLVAFKRGELLFVQNKINGLCAPAERSRLRDLAGMVDALPLVAYSHKEGRAAAVVRYRLLTGDGPKHWASWTPDHAMKPVCEHWRLQAEPERAGIFRVPVECMDKCKEEQG